MSLGGLGYALRRLLERGCEETDGNGVVVAEMAEARGLEPRCLYLGGLRDDDIPSKPSMDLLLPESVRRALGLADFTRHMRLQEHIFHRLSRSADHVFLSYPTAEGDAVVLPSVFIAGIAPGVEKPAGLLSPEESQSSRAGPPLASRLSDIGEIPPVDSHSLSVTHVDAYRSCPRRFFIEKVLSLEPPEITDFELEPITIGTVLHRVMERLVPQAGRDVSEFTATAATILDDVLRSEPLDPYFKALIRQSFLDMAPQVFELEESIREEGYSFHSAEQDVRGEPVPGVRLKGKVDRIDRGPGGGIAILDYKTGSGELASTRVRSKGATLQLPLYATLLRARGERPERVGVYSLRDLKVRWLPGKRDLKEGLTLEDFMEAALGFLQETAEGMARGRYPALPLEDQTCRNCHERPYCPYIQRGRLDREVP
jgi:ATP-dependent helicase/nuclease subunit B